MKKTARLFTSFLFTLTIQAQIGGTATYRFLSLSPSAFQTSLGGKQFVSTGYDIMQNFGNPALIDSTQNGIIGLNYANHLTDINYGQAGYVFHLPETGYLFAGIHYLNYGKFIAADDTGEKTGTFTASESALYAGYAYRFNERWSAGLNLKWIHSVLASYRSEGIAFDLGISYRHNGNEVALVFRNAGRQITTYNGTREALPFEIDLTYAKLLEHAPIRLYITLENLQKPRIAFINTARDQTDPNGNIQHENITIIHHIFRHIITGVEIFPRKRLNLRLGFNFRRAAELGLKDINFSSGFSAGLGIRLNRFALHYGYGQYHFAGNTHLIGLNIFLNAKQKN